MKIVVRVILISLLVAVILLFGTNIIPSKWRLIETPAVASSEIKLLAFDGAISDEFGDAVSVSGDTMVVGAPKKNHVNPLMGQRCGAAYVFTRSGSTWTQQQKLTASDARWGDQFGDSVSIYGDTIVVGAPYQEEQGEDKKNDTGAAYVFTRSGSTWTLQQKLTPSNAADGDNFGWSVSVHGDSTVVSAPKYSRPTGGAVYIFTRSDGTWTQQQKLTAGDIAVADFFGSSVSLCGDTTVVGAAWENSYFGAAYVFTRSGNTWTHQQKLTAGDAAGSGYFGGSVSISSDTAVIGGYIKNGKGAAYVFSRSGSTWTQQQKLTAGDAAGSGNFGGSVSINGDTAVIGASLIKSKGTAYIFSRSGSTWTQQQKLTAGNAAVDDFFGSSVSIYNSTVVVGARGNNNNTGTAYTYSSSMATEVFPTWLLPLIIFAALALVGTTGWYFAIHRKPAKTKRGPDTNSHKVGKSRKHRC